MSADVVKPRPADDPDEVLDAAKGAQSVVVLSVGQDGEFRIAASLNLSQDEILASLSRAQFIIHISEIGDD